MSGEEAPGRSSKKFRYQIGDSPFIKAETMSIGEGLRMDIQMGIPKVIVESDSQIVINSFTR